METIELDQELVKRFMALFQGNTRCFGQYNARTKKPQTIKSPYKIDHFIEHLEGTIGLGLVPILDDCTCWFAAIDIDVKGEDHVRGKEKVDIFEIEEKVRRNELPLIVCRSKSGGAHCYVFFKEPQRAGDVRVMLARWEVLLGCPGSEVFPKQSTLDQRDGDRPLGSWINLPYYDTANSERYCVDGGKIVTLDYFIELAEGKRCLLKQFEKQAVGDFDVGPPCLQKMLESPVEQGGRNTAVFQGGVFLQRAFPDDWRHRLDMFNKMALVTPLETREVRQIAGSIHRRQYQYKCREEPCRSLCNRELCKTRTYGVTPTDERANEIPVIDKVEKIMGTPVLWRLTIKEKIIELTTPQLFEYNMYRQAVAERLNFLSPRMKNDEWDQYLKDILAHNNMEVVQSTTMDDMYLDRVHDFCKRVIPDKNLAEDIRRQALQRGTPTFICITSLTGEREWFYAFRATDFIEHLRRRKQLTVPDYQIHTILGKILDKSLKRNKLRVVNTTVSNVWCIPEAHMADEPVPDVQTKLEY